MDKQIEYYQKLDKRTKEYKEWKANFDKQPKGLGDTIEQITSATGIKKAVKTVFGDDCGCDERKEKLNKLFSYKVKECFTEKEYNYIKNLIDSKTTKLDHNQQHEIKLIYERVFNRKLVISCVPCNFYKQIWKPLIDVYNKY